MNKTEYEVIIIGGSYAGLSAAMALGRSLRTTLIIDSVKPCNAQTPHSHNFLTQDGKTPREISELAKKQVLEYKTVEFHQGKAIDAKKTEKSFEIITENGVKFNSKKLIIATGIIDDVPDIKGFKESWGISLIHCPYCHGYEYKSKKTAIIGNGDKAFHLAPLVKNLTENVTILTRGKAEFTDEQKEKLEKHDINIIETEISELKHQNGMVKSIEFIDGKKIEFEAVYGVFPYRPHSEIPQILACEFTEMGHVKTDQFHKTNIPGMFACGDNSSMMRSVAHAVCTGNLTGAMVNMELTNENF